MDQKLPKEFFYHWMCPDCKTFNSIQNLNKCKECDWPNSIFSQNQQLAKALTTIISEEFPLSKSNVDLGLPYRCEFCSTRLSEEGFCNFCKQSFPLMEGEM